MRYAFRVSLLSKRKQNLAKQSLGLTRKRLRKPFKPLFPFTSSLVQSNDFIKFVKT